MPRLELRVGARFTGDVAVAVRAALQEAADLIAKMPATYMTYPNSGPVLPTARRRAPPVPGEVVIDAAFLGGFERWRCHARCGRPCAGSPLGWSLH